jgi:hypothetical protein
MIHHVVFVQLKPEVDAAALEELVRASRSLLLKIPEVLNVRSGRNVDPQSPWQFFFAIETDSLEKLRVTLEDPFHLKLMERVVKPAAEDLFALDYELDPSRDLKYS